MKELIRKVQYKNELEKEHKNKKLQNIWFINIRKLDEEQLFVFKEKFKSIERCCQWWFDTKYYGVNIKSDLIGSDTIANHDFVSDIYEISFQEFIDNFDFYKSKYKPVEF